MARVIWTEDMATGIRSIDSDHRMLLDILNSLHDDVAEGRGERQVGATLSALARYVDQHFAREERFLEQAGYPDLEAHAAAHRRMTTMVRQTCDQYRHEPGSVAPDRVCRFLQDWLVEHIRETDMAYVTHLRGEDGGARPAPGTEAAATEARPVTLHLPHDKLDLGYAFARVLRGGGERAAALEDLLRPHGT